MGSGTAVATVQRPSTNLPHTDIFTKGKDATNAAIFRSRSGIRNLKALRNLGTFASEIGIFTHTDDPDSDWDSYEKRCQIEREADLQQVNVDSCTQQLHVKEILKDRHEDRISTRAAAAERVLPNLRMKINRTDDANVCDASSVDYRDPNDYLRTPLIKAVIDRDSHKVKNLVETKTANLFIRDREGHNAFNIALNYGYMDIATYLQACMNAQVKEPQKKPVSA
jgi:hypothetical protein